jgi:hypothetical protein
MVCRWSKNSKTRLGDGVVDDDDDDDVYLLSFFLLDLSRLSLFSHLKHGSQPALTVPLAKSLPTLVSLAVVFLFSQRLSTRVVAATGAAHGHDRIITHWFDNRAVHAVIVEAVDLADVRAGGGLSEGELAGLFDGFDPLVGAVFAACGVGGGGAGIFERQVLVALGGC